MSYRTHPFLFLLMLAACAGPQHRAVGDWQASQGTLVLHLFDDGTGSFDGRSCTWQEVDEYSVKTNCERMVLDNAIRVFKVMEKDGVELGTLESHPTVVFIRSDSSISQGRQAENENTNTQEEDFGSALEPTWIGKNEAQQALGGQVLIATFNTSESSATLKITLPDMSVSYLENMSVGSRKVITISGESYFLDLLDAGDVMGAQVSLTRRK